MPNVSDFATIVGNVRRIRVEEGVAMADLAEGVSTILGRQVARSALYKTEIGARRLGVEELAAIAHVLGRPVEEFFAAAVPDFAAAPESPVPPSDLAALRDEVAALRVEVEEIRARLPPA